MKKSETSNGRVIADYIAATGRRSFPPEILDVARRCLADWLGTAIGASDEPAGSIVRDVAAGWRSKGVATVLFGDSTSAPIAALCNGTLAHCLDFDDTYTKSLTHISAPVWAATLALGQEIGAGEAEVLAAYITGFETASRTGYNLGETVTARGWHSTGVFGRLGAAAASAALLQLDSERALSALGVAATQASGLTASFGSMSKPFHAGKAAMDGILSAQLAASGFQAALDLLEPGGGLDSALIQDQSAQITPANFSAWEILNNSFKPYAACHLTHPAVDAARQIASSIPEPRQIEAVHATVSSLAEQITGRASGDPSTPLQGKFDLKYCIALGLYGGRASAADFREPWHPDPAICAVGRNVKLEIDPTLTIAAARLRVTLADGRKLAAEVPISKGHPGNPMSWDDMWEKFQALVEPRLGRQTTELFSLLRKFGQGDALPCIRAIVSRTQSGAAVTN